MTGFVISQIDKLDITSNIFRKKNETLEPDGL